MLWGLAVNMARGCLLYLLLSTLFVIKWQCISFLRRRAEVGGLELGTLRSKYNGVDPLVTGGPILLVSSCYT